jgi:cardiolipin synthase A/B
LGTTARKPDTASTSKLKIASRGGDAVRNEFDRSRALRWFAVIAILAVVTWVITALFGPSPDYKLAMTPAAALNSPQFVHELEALTNSRVSADNSVESIPNGDRFYEEELQAIASARSSVNLEAYIVQRGDIAKRIIAALTERQRHGVQVRFVVDAMGSLTTPKLYFKELRAAGGKVEFYHPMRWNTWMRSNNRTHRELMIVDGSTGFIGGAGIADQWWKDEPPKDPRWRDEVFRVKGDAVRALQSTFVENWLEASGELLAGEMFYPPQSPSGTAMSMVVTSTPSQGGSTRARVLFQTLVASAHKSIQITTPYFLPDTSLREELVKARQRGVEVRILLPGGKSDHLMTRASSRRVYGPLLLSGAEIYEYQPSMVHAKIMVIDGLWSVVGSTNFDNRSFGLNDEVNLVTLDPMLAQQLRSQFDTDMTRGIRVNYDTWKKRSLWERGIEMVGFLIERQQ